MTAVDTDRILELADTSPEGMYELFEEHGWGDGLPLVPPTPARVDAMLEHAAGDVDEELGILLPRAGVVTRRVVAINAVLAGCKPDYFPVVLSATRALAHPDVNLRCVNATTHSVAPLVIVSSLPGSWFARNASRAGRRPRPGRARRRRCGPSGRGCRGVRVGRSSWGARGR